jgi:hypothetical protein
MKQRLLKITLLCLVFMLSINSFTKAQLYPLETVTIFGSPAVFTNITSVSSKESCLNHGGTYTFEVNVQNQGNATICKNVSYDKFTVSGGLLLNSSSGNRVEVTPTLYRGRYDKGRIIVDYTCEYDTTIYVCGGGTLPAIITLQRKGRAYADVYQIFNHGYPIVGPRCVSSGDHVTYSVRDLVSGTSMLGIGIDSYYWTSPSNWPVDYFSADSSSITLNNIIVSSSDSLTVVVGRCNTSKTTIKVGGAVPPPTINGFGTCIPAAQHQATFNLSVDPEVQYEWNISIDGNGYSYVTGNNQTQGPITIDIGKKQGFIVLKSKPKSSASPYCGQRLDTIPVIRTLDSTVVINGPACVEKNKSYTYSITAPGINHFQWSLPSGWSINSSSSANASSITVDVGPNGAQGSVEVINTLCPTGASTLNVNIAPEAPILTAPVTCYAPNTSYTFTIVTDPNATTYQWTFPAGWSPSTYVGLSPTVSVVSGTIGGEISVAAIGCNGATTPATITATILPPTPIDILVDKSCINLGKKDQIVLTAVPTINGAAYSWNIPSTWTFVGSATGASVTVETDGVSGQSASVSITNICGSSTVYAESFTFLGIGVPVTILYIPMGQDDHLFVAQHSVPSATHAWYDVDGNNVFSGQIFRIKSISTQYCVDVTNASGCTTRTCYGTIPPGARSQAASALPIDNLLLTFPNPSNGEAVNVLVNEELVNGNITISNSLGIPMFKGRIKNKISEINTSGWPTGNYIVSVRNGRKGKTTHLQIKK